MGLKEILQLTLIRSLFIELKGWILNGVTLTLYAETYLHQVNHSLVLQAVLVV